MKFKQAGTVLLTATILQLSAFQCFAIDNIYRKSIAKANIKELKTELSFFAGKLTMGTSTDKMAECYYGYNDDYIEPYVHFSESDKSGILVIKNKKNHDIPRKNKESNRWRIELNNDVQHNLTVDMLAGEADLDLSNANMSRMEFRLLAGEAKLNLKNTELTKLICKMTAGEMLLNLSGERKTDFDAEISGGIGEMTIIVPSNTGVKVHITGLLGEAQLPGFLKDGKTYTNPAWGKAKRSITLYITGGIGNIEFKME